jgi:hypothetical protein
MKTLIIFSVAFIVATMLFPSCKKDTNTNSTTVLTIHLSKTAISLPTSEVVSISVTNHDGVDVTSASLIKVNGTTLSTGSFNPSSIGTFSFVATKDGIASAAVILTVTTTPVIVADSLFVSLSASTIALNTFDYVVVTIKDKNANDITSSSQILINGVATTSNKYVPDAIGNYIIAARNGTTPSTSKTLTVVPVSPSPFTRKLLIEDFTGTWCGNCPRVFNALDNYVPTHSNAIVVTIHGPAGSSDPFQYQYTTNLSNAFSIGGSYPVVLLNRYKKWDEVAATLDNEFTKWAPLGLAIESNVAGTNIIGKAKVKFNVTTDKPMKIIVALVENGLILNQANYSSNLYGGGNPIIGFTHNGVLRRASTDIFGDDVPVAAQTKNNIWELPFTIPTSGVNASGISYTVNPAKCSIVAYVIDASTAKKGVYNVQSADVGVNKSFD